MEISLLADSVTAVAATQVLGFAKFHTLTSSTKSSSDQSSSLQISSLIFPIDAVAPPTIKRNYLKKAPRSFVRKRCRTRRRSLTSGDDEGGEDGGFFGGDGPFGGGGDGDGDGGGGGGGRWNFDGSDWEETPAASWYDPAFDFVYEVFSWIAFSNCLHYAFKKVLRVVAEDREKASLIC